MQLFLTNQEFLIIWNSSPTFPVVFLFLELLVQLNYPLKACWKSYFWLSEGSEILKFSGALPLTPVGGLTAPPNPQLFAPSLRSGLTRTQREGQGVSKLRSREANFFMQPWAQG